MDAINWKRARCNDGNGTLTHLFFSEDLIDIARAKAICSKCSLAVACLATALEREEPWGVWGGQLLVNGSDRRPQAQTGPTTETPPARSGGGRGTASTALRRQDRLRARSRRAGATHAATPGLPRATTRGRRYRREPWPGHDAAR